MVDYHYFTWLRQVAVPNCRIGAGYNFLKNGDVFDMQATAKDRNKAGRTEERQLNRYTVLQGTLLDHCGTDQPECEVPADFEDTRGIGAGQAKNSSVGRETACWV